MVSDTQGNKSFLAARMRKTSLSLLSGRCAGFASVRGARDICHTRTVSVCRHSCRAGISRRRNIDLRYTTKRASISVGNEAPRLRLFDVLRNVHSLFDSENFFLHEAGLTEEFKQLQANPTLESW